VLIFAAIYTSCYCHVVSFTINCSYCSYCSAADGRRMESPLTSSMRCNNRPHNTGCRRQFISLLYAVGLFLTGLTIGSWINVYLLDWGKVDVHLQVNSKNHYTPHSQQDWERTQSCQCLLNTAYYIRKALVVHCMAFVILRGSRHFE